MNIDKLRSKTQNAFTDLERMLEFAEQGEIDTAYELLVDVEYSIGEIKEELERA